MEIEKSVGACTRVKGLGFWGLGYRVGVEEFRSGVLVV